MPNDLATRVQNLNWVFKRLVPVPEDWKSSRPATKNKNGESLECLPCESYRELIMAWRKAMEWTEGLDNGLATMLASVVSVRSVGSQLWIKLIGPASSGKSTLCEAISVNKKYVYAKSTIRGFHSGYKTDAEGAMDHSLIDDLRNKTLVIKDGDTLLRLPNLAQVLSEARDIYDGTSRTHYRHGIKRDYEGIRTTILLAGTKTLRQIDSSELGERFLDCVIMEDIDPDLEDDILLRAAYRAERNVSVESDGKPESYYDRSLTYAYQLTGGYVGWLRQNASSLLAEVNMGDEARRQCMRLGLFVAYMRARPSRVIHHEDDREMGARLVEQHVRLAMCISVVLNKRSVDQEVLKRVTKVALDTSRGITLQMVGHLYRAGEDGMMGTTLASYVDCTDHEAKSLLRFLRRIGVVRLYSPSKVKGIRAKVRWRLTKRVRSLYKNVMIAPP